MGKGDNVGRNDCQTRELQMKNTNVKKRMNSGGRGESSMITETGYNIFINSHEVKV